MNNPTIITLEIACNLALNLRRSDGLPAGNIQKTNRPPHTNIAYFI